MKIQLWSCQYDPEPLGIGPVSRVWAQEMVRLGHRVDVVAGHPHYPSPEWGSRALPYREVRGGIPVTRLPLRIGRVTKSQRMIQEMSFATSLTAAAPFLGSPDLLVSVSPSFPALLPAMVNARLRRTPWLIWLQDILPDGAASTGYLEDRGVVYRGSRKLESAAYESAAKIIVLSESFRTNLLAKGVPDEKIEIAYNPATFPVRLRDRSGESGRPPRIICIGNIGRSQNLEMIVRAFQADEKLAEIGAELVITGTGVAEPDVRAAVSTDRVKMLGLVSSERLEDELRCADVGIVTQSYEGGEFNVPSKLMNYLAIGLPVVVSVDAGGEVAGIVDRSGAGWVTDHRDPREFTRALSDALSDRDELGRRGAAGFEFASDNFSPGALARRFDEVLSGV